MKEGMTYYSYDEADQVESLCMSNYHLEDDNDMIPDE